MVRIDIWGASRGFERDGIPQQFCETHGVMTQARGLPCPWCIAEEAHRLLHLQWQKNEFLRRGIEAYRDRKSTRLNSSHT